MEKRRNHRHNNGSGNAPRRKVALTRLIAWDVLQAVDLNDAYANLALPPKLERARLNRLDSAFTVELTYGTLRNRGYYDWVITQASGREVADIEIAVLNACRLGVHQLLGMRVSDHAAVNEMVNLVHKKVHSGAAGFTNATLRSVQRLGAKYFTEKLAAISDVNQRLSIQYSHPLWIISAYRSALTRQQRYGAQIPADDEALEQLLQANNESPYVHLVARPGVCDREVLADSVERRGNDVAYTSLSPWGLITSGGDPSHLPQVRTHIAGVEDQGSQLMAGLCAMAPVKGRDQYWLDLCAGPGGKAALLAALARERNAYLWTNEVTPHRAELVRAACSAFPEVKHECGDGREFRLPKEVAEGFDRILVDAPCTGLGALRRHPESRYRGRGATVGDLASIQYELLKHAFSLLRPGGIVTYVTCSPHVSETIAVVERLKSAESGLEVLDSAQIAEQLIDHESWPQGLGSSAEYLQLWPHIHGADAMFAATICKLKI